MSCCLFVADCLLLPPQVCFRHSKHSIKCDISAPCPECDSGLKLYSYDQCRRHLDVVRAERRFESIEVDRAEDQIEKMHELDGIRGQWPLGSHALSLPDNGKRVLQLLDVLHARLEAGREEERAWRESTCGALREVSASCARALHKTEELAEWARAAAEHVALSGEFCSFVAPSIVIVRRCDRFSGRIA